MKPVMCLVLLVSFMRQCKQHILQMTIWRTKHLSILSISIHNFYWQYQDISSRYGDMRHYQPLGVTGRNRLITWTEKSVGAFFSYSVSFSTLALRLFTFSGNSILPEPYSLLFIIIKYISIVTTQTWFVCSRMLGGTMCMVLYLFSTGKRASHSEL